MKDQENEDDNKGNIILATLFTILIAVLGLSLLSFSMFHSRVRGARSFKLKETERMRQALVYRLHRMREQIMSCDLRDFAEPELDYFSPEYFPPVTGFLAPDITITCEFANLTIPKDGYRKTRLSAAVTAVSKHNPYRLRAEVVIGLVSGQVPVTEIPSLQAIPVENLDEPAPSPPPPPAETGDRASPAPAAEVGFNTTEFLLEAMKIQAPEISWAAMRERFGFQVSDDPIPEGIHLLIENNVLSCVFVQGNVDQLVFSIKEGIQTFRIVYKGTAYDYHYKPGEQYFISRDNPREEPWLFEEKIVVNGDIWSLEQAGDAAFLESAGIVLFASGTVVIRSDLVSENFKLGKIPSTNLTVVSTFADLFGKDKDKRQIMVEKTGTPPSGDDKKEKTTLQVSIITDGKLANKESRLDVQGSVTYGELTGNGTMSIVHRPAGSGAGFFFRTVDFKGVTHFLLHALEEVLP